jgi:hypothetical protein
MLKYEFEEKKMIRKGEKNSSQHIKPTISIIKLR